MIFGRKKRDLITRQTSRWLVAWGDVAEIESVWKEGQFAIVTSLHWAISNCDRFVITGDIWLSNRHDLALNLDESDLEIVVRLWVKWELKSLDLLTGMFGLVIYDRQLAELIIVRDPIGGRTIYYTAGKNRWIAPQLNSLNPYRSNQLDPIALRDYLTCSFVPGARTMWQDVREIRPGTALKLPEDKIDTYWQLQERVIAFKSLAWHGNKLRAQLEQVMGEYLPKQAPVGIFLSGGLDSSCITALAAQLHDAPIHTYSIHVVVKI